MAIKLTDKTALTGNLATDDLFMVVDASDTSSSAQGTSKKVTNEQIIQTTKVSVSASNFASMDDTGVAGTFVTLLPASGAGHFYVILNVCINTVVTASPTNNTNLYIGYDPSQITDYVIQHRRFNNGVSSRLFNLAPFPINASGPSFSLLSGKSLVLYSNQNFNGNFTADVFVTYRKCSMV